MENQRVRIADIAKELGLSTATVSNVIHGKTKKISDETAKRVLELVEKRGYFPSMAGILLAAIAVIAPVKVLNMILGGGIIRSGGKTAYAMWIDLIGTWVFGVPLGLVSAFVWKLDVAYVYFILSLEECIRLGISLVIFRRRVWMESIQ